METQSKIPEFSVVEIEVNSLCNRKCSYCPVSILPPPNTPEYMSLHLFHKIIDELSDMNYCGQLSYHLYSEPLLRRDLDLLVKIAKQKIPNAFQLLYTNGDFLSNKKYQLLLDSGIDHFLVTRHNNNHIDVRPHQSVQYPKDLILSNRGGLLTDIEKEKKSLFYPCYSPTDNLIISSSGDVLLCCDDAERKEIMGNIINKTISEVWFSPRFVKYRKTLQKGNQRQALELCNMCNNIEYCKPKQNYQSVLIRYNHE